MDLSRHRWNVALLLCLLLLPAAAPGAEPAGAAADVELIIWEDQNWESNGGFSRLTLWSDGRSEVRVVPLQIFVGEAQRYRPKPGWEKLEQPRRLEFVRSDVYPPAVVREKIRAALAAGIDQLATFRPDYLDGGGTRIVIQRHGQPQELVIPYFSDRQRGSLNHRRFQAAAQILGEFDRDALILLPAP